MADIMTSPEVTGRAIFKQMVDASESDNPPQVPEYTPAVTHVFNGPNLRAPEAVGNFRHDVMKFLGNHMVFGAVEFQSEMAVSELGTNSVIHSPGGLLEARFGYTGAVDHPDSVVLEMLESTRPDNLPLPPDVEKMMNDRVTQGEELGLRGLSMVRTFGFQLGRTMLQEVPHTASMWAQLPLDTAA